MKKLGKMLVSLGFGGLMLSSILTNSALAESEQKKLNNVFVYKDYPYSFMYKDYKAFSRSQKSNKIVLETEYSPLFYKWTEPQLEEEGIIQRMKFGINVESDNFFTYPKFILYGGSVNYDGQTTGGNILIINNDVTYSGYGIELKGGYKFNGNGNVTVYVAVGFESWNRAIDSLQSNQTIVPIIGYTEKWSNYCVKIGMSPNKDLGNHYIYGDVYAKIPFRITNKVKFFDVKVRPKSKIGFGIEVGLGIKNFLKRNINSEISEIGLFYEYDQFGKSATKIGNFLGQTIFVYQPESTRKLLGVKVGIKF